MATKYYNDAGKELTGKGLKSYLKALAAAQASGKEYTGKKYYTQDELESKYNGYSLGIIQQLGGMRKFLSEAPALYKQQADQALMDQATAQYEGEYQSAKTSAANQYNTAQNALNTERSALDTTYGAQVNAAQKATAQNVDNLSGSMLSRGLGRSSYAGALQNTALQSGANTVNSILGEKTQKANDIQGQLTTLGTNYGSTLATLDSTKQSGVKNAFNTLKQTDYEKNLNSAQARYAYALDLLARKKKVASSSGSSRSSGSSSSNNSNNSNNNSSSGNWLSDLINSFL